MNDLSNKVTWALLILVWSITMFFVGYDFAKDMIRLDAINHKVGFYETFGTNKTSVFLWRTNTFQ